MTEQLDASGTIPWQRADVAVQHAEITSHGQREHAETVREAWSRIKALRELWHPSMRPIVKQPASERAKVEPDARTGGKRYAAHQRRVPEPHM